MMTIFIQERLSTSTFTEDTLWSLLLLGAYCYVNECPR
jgi:hypothetical protein